MASAQFRLASPQMPRAGARGASLGCFRDEFLGYHYVFRPLDSGHGLGPWALARDRVPSEGKSSRGRPERSAAKSKGDEVGAPGSARGGPLLSSLAWRSPELVEGAKTAVFFA
jgi:hypothetical protein